MATRSREFQQLLERLELISPIPRTHRSSVDTESDKSHSSLSTPTELHEIEFPSPLSPSLPFAWSGEEFSLDNLFQIELTDFSSNSGVSNCSNLVQISSDCSELGSCSALEDSTPSTSSEALPPVEAVEGEIPALHASDIPLLPLDIVEALNRIVPLSPGSSVETEGIVSPGSPSLLVEGCSRDTLGIASTQFPISTIGETGRGFDRSSPIPIPGGNSSFLTHPKRKRKNKKRRQAAKRQSDLEKFLPEFIFDSNFAFFAPLPPTVGTVLEPMSNPESEHWQDVQNSH